MKAKTTIDERIVLKNGKLQYWMEQSIKQQHKIDEAEKKTRIIAEKMSEIKIQIQNLEAKKARQQKDQAIGDMLVESGVITEQQNQEIQKLPVPEKKENPPIYNPEV